MSHSLERTSPKGTPFIGTCTKCGRSNLHYQHEVSPKELQLQRDKDERERLGLYLGRAIADRLADAYAGRMEGTSRASHDRHRA